MPILNKNILFCIPIYIESKSEYSDFLTKSRDNLVEYQIQKFKKIGFDRNSTFEQDLRRNPPITNPEQIPWRYNRIIGWIEFYAEGEIIKADLWFTKAKRISKRTKNIIIANFGKISDVVDTYHLNNEQICTEVEQYLDNLQKGGFGCSCLKRRCIDKSLFWKNLRYMDIKKMIQDLVRARNIW